MDIDLMPIADLGLAASLVTLNFKIIETSRDNRGRLSFIFNHSKTLDKAIAEYWSNSLEVPARQYFDNTKMLKSRIYSEGQ